MKKIRVFFATLKEGIKNLWKHRAMGMASIISISLVTVILGGILVSTLTLNQYILDLEGKVDDIIVYMERGIEQEKIDSIKQSLEDNQYVKSIEYKSSEDGLQEYLDSIDEEDEYLLEGMESAIPVSFVVKLNDINDISAFITEVKQLDGVSNIDYFKDQIDKIVKISDYVRIGGAAAVGLLIIISILVISNTIKLTVAARRKEIEIKKYIGATNGVITGPFIIEGAIFGLIGSGIAYAIIYYGYDLLFKRFAVGFQKQLAGYLIPLEYIDKDIMIIFLTLGIGIGIIGSLLSVRKYLKV